MKIYTKTGDKGISSLYNGTRIPKDSFEFDCLGEIDLLNSNLGLMKAFYNELKPTCLYNPPGAGALYYKHSKCLDSGYYYEWFILDKIITNIQCVLMDISSYIATPFAGDKYSIPESYITDIENLIDRFETLLPSIKNFVVPSGNTLISQTHICRVLTRGCERNFLKLVKNDSYESAENSKIGIYLNRLSDLLFTVSRFVAFTLNITEDQYSKNKGLFN